MPRTTASAAYPQPGARPVGPGSCRFRVWAPESVHVSVQLASSAPRTVPMERREHGLHEVVAEGVEPGARYRYRLDSGVERPDPASHLQPEGVHGPSEVVDPAFAWTDRGWRGLPLEQYVLYELHVGTFSPEGTFAGVERQLPRLVELGVTAVELMPVAQFPGGRNWGYDGVHPYAVQTTYGGPAGLKQLIDACHRHGLALVLDVVYNHLGPEGNYLRDFGPYFTDRYRTPWGEAVNFDGAHSDQVRAYFIANALRWVEEFHIDALRLDALHAVFDFSARPFLAELAAAVRAAAERTGRRIHLIAESDLNDTRLIRAPASGGFGLDAQWSDDYHHALHALLTGERHGYYLDFGELDHLARAMRAGYTYSGQRSAFRQRRHGNDPRELPGRQFVVCAQNHDQVGNRMLGERLTALVDRESLKLAAAAVLLSPYIPLLFMGEEYGETAPFLYFISHGDPDLVQAVRRGRRQEFPSADEPPDPQAEQTFARARIDPDLARGGWHRTLARLYRRLLALRREVPALRRPGKAGLEVAELDGARALLVRRTRDGSSAALALCFAEAGPSVDVDLPLSPGRWRCLLDTADTAWEGPGSPAPGQLVVEQGQPARLTLRPRSAQLHARDED